MISASAACVRSRIRLLNIFVRLAGKNPHLFLFLARIVEALDTEPFPK